MLRTSKPPPMSRSVDNAICATTSTREKGMRPTRAAPIRLRPCVRNDVARSTRAARKAGKRPNNSTHASVIAPVKPRTRASSVVSTAIGPAPLTVVVSSTRVPQVAANRPSALETMASRTSSTSIC